MTDKARFAAAGAMNNVRTAIDSAKRIGFPGNPVRSVLYDSQLQSLYGAFCCVSAALLSNMSSVAHIHRDAAWYL